MAHVLYLSWLKYGQYATDIRVLLFGILLRSHDLEYTPIPNPLVLWECFCWFGVAGIVRSFWVFTKVILISLVCIWFQYSNFVYLYLVRALFGVRWVLQALGHPYMRSNWCDTQKLCSAGLHLFPVCHTWNFEATKAGESDNSNNKKSAKVRIPCPLDKICTSNGLKLGIMPKALQIPTWKLN